MTDAVPEPGQVTARPGLRRNPYAIGVMFLVVVITGVSVYLLTRSSAPGPDDTGLTACRQIKASNAGTDQTDAQLRSIQDNFAHSGYADLRGPGAEWQELQRKFAAGRFKTSSAKALLATLNTEAADKAAIYANCTKYGVALP